MKEIKSEFELFLSNLVESYFKSTETVLENPANLQNVGELTRDFNSKAKLKIEELAKKNSVNIINMQIELSSIQVKYHSKLMHGRL